MSLTESQPGFPFAAPPAIMVTVADGTTNVTIPGDAPMAVELLLAVRGGDVDLVRRLLSENPDLAEQVAAGSAEVDRLTSLAVIDMAVELM